MYDTVKAVMMHDTAGEPGFLSTVPQHLDTYINGGIDRKNGYQWERGKLGNLIVSVTDARVLIQGSLSKYLHGNNIQPMTRADAAAALQMLSDTLHLPLERAKITRLDFGACLKMEYPTSLYFRHLGALPYCHRLEQPHGLEYRRVGIDVAMYDKQQEMRASGETVPAAYAGMNVLRYEKRFEARLGRCFNVQAVTGAMLCSEQFYLGVLNDWQLTYSQIGKINDIVENDRIMINNVRDLNTAGVLRLIDDAGGQVAYLKLLKERQDRGELDKAQAFKLRQAVIRACEVRATAGGRALTMPSDAIKELDSKVAEVVRSYE